MIFERGLSKRANQRAAIRLGGGAKMFRPILMVAAALSLGGCGAANNILPVNADDVSACLQQGTYYDRTTRQCAPVRQPPPPTPEQRSAQADFERRVQARAAKCTTGSKEMCRVYAQQEEIRTQDFCFRSYGSAAHNILGYKAIGWPMEMTAEKLATGDPGFPSDLLDRLVRAGYSERWQTPEDFQREARQRCLDGRPF